MSYDMKLEEHYIELIKEKNLGSFVAALLNYGNEIGLKNEKIKGVYHNEDGTIEIITQKPPG
jgi:hypothetical protein